MRINVKLLLCHGHAVEIHVGVPMHLQCIDYAGRMYVCTEFANSITILGLAKTRLNYLQVLMLAQFTNCNCTCKHLSEQRMFTSTHMHDHDK